ncbi:MAG: hypothetical protein QOF36_1773 [Microbacteriaceae bacterium]|nr:hypothetical protein [Microbacteriaceae bacterium]
MRVAEEALHASHCDDENTVKTMHTWEGVMTKTENNRIAFAIGSAVVTAPTPPALGAAG